MRLAREIERRLERLVDGVSAALFRGQMQPIDLANRLVRHADLLVEHGPVGPQLPNVYVVGVHPGDIKDGDYTDEVAQQLAVAVDAMARDRGWRLEGPVRVTLQLEAEVPAGSISCAAASSTGELPMWAQLLDPALGRALELRHYRELVGRAEDVDLLLAEPEVSRHHAIIFTEDATPSVIDLSSSNGTRVNGVAVGAGPVALHPGDTIAFGPASFTFRLS